ncbi:MAG: sugar kinase [Caldithrix sp.]|nr:sugar kinase [Caldithrix sp.]
MKILVVGSIAYDSVETPYGKRENEPGGSALYFSAAASFFNSVNVVGVVGSDFDTSKISFLKKRHVNFDGLYVESGETFRWGGRYHTNMNKRDTLFTYLNVFEDFNPTIPDHYKDSQYVFLANIDPDVQLDVLQQISNPKLTVLDTMNFWINGKKDVLLNVVKKSDILILNDEELQELSGHDNLVNAGREIIQLGPKYVIIKKGEHGAMLYYNDRFFISPAFPLDKVIDPTGAGDTFAGGFLGYLASANEMSDQHLRRSIVYGGVMASFVVQDFSFKQLQNLDKQSINQRYKEFKELTIF